MNIYNKFLSSLPAFKSAKTPKKKILVLEGGGMRGIFLTGVLQAFTDVDYFPWKLVIGSSAGALTGTAYAAGQIHLARDAFFTKLLTGKFINLSNIFRAHEHILNLDWMINTIINGSDPFDFTRLRRTCRVLITATNCPDYTKPETIYLDSKNDDIITALKATAAIPFLYRGFVKYGDYHLLDGGLMDPVPYQKAISLGFKEKEILVVLTRPRGYRKKEESFWIHALYENYYKDPQFQPLVKAMENRYLMYNSILDDLEHKRTDITVIYPPKDFKVDRLTQEDKKILEGFEQGVTSAKKYLKNQGKTP